MANIESIDVKGTAVPIGDLKGIDLKGVMIDVASGGVTAYAESSGYRPRTLLTGIDYKDFSRIYIVSLEFIGDNGEFQYGMIDNQLQEHKNYGFYYPNGLNNALAIQNNSGKLEITTTSGFFASKYFIYCD